MIHIRSVAGLLAALAVAAFTATPPGGSPTGGAPTGGGGTSASPSQAEPSGSGDGGSEPTGSARLGRGGMSVAFVPTMMAIESMQADGWDIEVSEFESTSTEIQAAVEGAVDMTSASAAATMTAIDAGLDSKFFLARYINEFVLVAKAGLETCESLDGMRVAIHAQTDITGLLTRSWFDKNCPDAAPNIQIVEGSENRLAGLLQDQLDASPLDMQNTQQIMDERPGDFVVVANFVEDFPLLAGVYSASPEYLEANEPLVKEFIRRHLEVWDQIYDDPQILIDESEERLPEVEPALIEPIVEQYLDLEIFQREGDLQEDRVTDTIEFFSEAAGFTNVGAYDDVVDRSYLDEVLAEE